MKVGIIGGGACGLTAAITAARQGAEVVLFESNDCLGKKILATGNGRCNLGNLEWSPDCYHCSDKDWLEQCFKRFDTDELFRFFQSVGLIIKSKNGYLYPYSEQAMAVAEVLRNEVKSLCVDVKVRCRVQDVSYQEKTQKFAVSSGDDTYYTDRVILCTGGKAAPKTGSDGSGYKLAKKLGHTVTPVLPALVQLQCSETFFQKIAGVRVEGIVTLAAANGEKTVSEFGEIQITDYGISGIPVFQLSRTVNYRLQKEKSIRAYLDFLPDFDRETWSEMTMIRRLLEGDRDAEAFFAGIVHKKLMLLILELAGVDRHMMISDVSEEQFHAINRLLKEFPVEITGSNSFEQAQVCAGGVDISQVDANLESRRIPGLYFAGELLDVDGRCGGYNLHWAWCSGYLAGMAASEKRGV